MLVVLCESNQNAHSIVDSLLGDDFLSPNVESHQTDENQSKQQPTKAVDIDRKSS